MKGPSIVFPLVWGANTRMDEPQFFSPLDSVFNPESRTAGRTAFGLWQSLFEISVDLVLTRIVSSSRVNELIRERDNGTNRSFYSVHPPCKVCRQRFPSAHRQVTAYSGGHRTMATAVRANRPMARVPRLIQNSRQNSRRFHGPMFRLATGLNYGPNLTKTEPAAAAAGGRTEENQDHRGSDISPDVENWMRQAQ